MSNIKPPLNTSLEVDNTSITFEEIENVISAFYSKVSIHPTLMTPFSSVEDWPYHIDKLTHFWWCRFGGEPYLQISYNPAGKHFVSGFTPELLKDWLTLFKQVLDEKLTEEKAQIWFDLASRMGVALNSRNEWMKSQTL